MSLRIIVTPIIHSYHSFKYNANFKENLKVFTAEDFIAELTQHIPPARVRLFSYYGLYSSKSRGKWKEWSHVVKLAPDGWREKNA